MFISKKDEKFLAMASHYASKSTMNSRHGCIVVLNGVVVANGFNHLRNYSSDKMLNQCYSCHAEIAAVRNAMKFTKIKQHDEHRQNSLLKRMTLYVVRLNNDDEFLDSKPCIHCYSTLKEIGVKNIIYSDGISCSMINFKNDPPCKISTGYKYLSFK
jgi:deoxycytidylate deaminase